VAELLDHVQKGDQRRFKDFCEALVKSDQEFIVTNYLECSRPVEAREDVARGDATDAVSTDAEDMPLSKESAAKLTASWNQLIDSMISANGSALFSNLYAYGVFSQLQLKKLKASNLCICIINV